MRDDGLLPLGQVPTAPAPGKASADGDAPGTIVIELGQVRVRIDGQSNAAILAQVLDRVLR